MRRSGKWANFVIALIGLRTLLYRLSIGVDEEIDRPAMRAEGDKFTRRRTRHPSNRNEGAQNQRYERDLSPNLSKDARHGLPPIFRSVGLIISNGQEAPCRRRSQPECD